MRAPRPDERFHPPVPPQHAIVEVDDDQAVGQRLDDAVAELAQPFDLVGLAAQLVVQARVLERRRRLRGDGRQQRHVLAVERLAARPAAGGKHGDRHVRRDARHEAEQAGVAPLGGFLARQAARRHAVVDRDHLAGQQPRAERRVGVRPPAAAAAEEPGGRDRLESRRRRRVRPQEQRHAIDAERLLHALDEPRAQPVEIEIAVQIARERHERASVVVPIAVVETIERRLDGAPQPRRDQRDDERREQRPEAAVLIVGAEDQAREPAACRRR